jgi:hypothetical protein
MARQSAATEAGPPRGKGRDGFTRLDAEYDSIVRAIYRAGSGLAPWTVPLERIVLASAATSVVITAFDRRSDAVALHHSFGARLPQAATDYIRSAHATDPRLALVRRLEVGQWMACQEHFDEALVATRPARAAGTWCGQVRVNVNEIRIGPGIPAAELDAIQAMLGTHGSIPATGEPGLAKVRTPSEMARPAIAASTALVRKQAWCGRTVGSGRVPRATC